MSDYDTPLTAEQALKYRAWKAALPHDLQNSSDYDLQGAYLDNMQKSSNDHMGDKFKKPNHMTFSNQSIYSNPQQQGGEWTDNTFWASPYNLQQHSAIDLADYFKRVEPDGSVVLPYNYRLPGQPK